MVDERVSTLHHDILYIMIRRYIIYDLKEICLMSIIDNNRQEEANANCVKPLVRVQNTGVRVDSPEAIDVELMVQKLLQEKKQMHSQNILHSSTQTTKEILQTLTSR